MCSPPIGLIKKKRKRRRERKEETHDHGDLTVLLNINFSPNLHPLPQKSR